MPKSQKRNYFSLTALVCVTLIVCSVSIGCHLKPNWGPQGTIGMQRDRAAIHDPFPSNDLGPPIMGVRPPGFEQPKSEPTSLQTSPFARRGMQGGQYTPAYGFLNKPDAQVLMLRYFD